MKIKKSTINDTGKYSVQHYPASGIFLNTSESGLTEYIYVNHKNGNCFLLDNVQNCEGMFEEEVELELSEIKEGSVSETFALRMLSVGLHSELLKYKDIK